MTVYSVLFLCTGNSARSILAEAQLNAIGGGRFTARSAGSHPTGTVNPFALEWLASMGISTYGLRSKSWDEFAAPAGPNFDAVITVCDQAASEQCPFWPGHPTTAHWGMPDPAAVQGPDDEKRAAFRDTAMLLRRRLEILTTIPLGELDKRSFVQTLGDIGKTP